MKNKHIAKDIDGRVILKTDRVKPVGPCKETTKRYCVSIPMKKMVDSGIYFSIAYIESDKLIKFGGYSWHPSDLQIERDPIILPPIEAVTFNVNNLDIE